MSGKTAWITGASSGIGEGLAKEWLARGGRCVLSGRNVAALEAVAANAPDGDPAALIAQAGGQSQQVYDLIQQGKRDFAAR